MHSWHALGGLTAWCRAREIETGSLAYDFRRFLRGPLLALIAVGQPLRNFDFERVEGRLGG